MAEPGDAALTANLDALDGEEVRIYERRRAHLSDFCASAAEALLNGFPDDDAFRARYAAFFGREAALPPDMLPENRAGALERLRCLNQAERAGLCRELAERLGEQREAGLTALLCERYRLRQNDEGDLADEESGDAGEEAHSPTENRISYLRNYYADMAYASFAQVLAEPTVTYSQDFAGVCEDVYYGRAGCCILPVENTTDGCLASFRALIRKYELKTVLTCSVDTGDTAMTRFALLKKNMEELPCPGDLAGAGFFEFDVSLPDLDSLSGLIGAARLNGLVLSRIDSLPDYYAGSGYTYAMAFGRDGGFLDGFLCYLLLEAPQFVPMGLYRELKV